MLILGVVQTCTQVAVGTAMLLVVLTSGDHAKVLQGQVSPVCSGTGEICLLGRTWLLECMDLGAKLLPVFRLERVRVSEARQLPSIVFTIPL